MSKLKIWKETEEKWNKSAVEACEKMPLKSLKFLPKMVGITKETARFLRLKSLYWMWAKDTRGEIRRGFLKAPFLYVKRYLKSFFSPKPFHRQGDFFYYSLTGEEEFRSRIKQPDTLFVLGFSYCHKPFECPSGRFTDQCIRDPRNLVCRQCFIGKCLTMIQGRKAHILQIPTVHYVGAKILELMEKHREKKILFLITACEMTLHMFADFGNMAGISGIGVRLDGRICNTMEAFALSETGVKPGLTVVLGETQERMLSLLYEV